MLCRLLQSLLLFGLANASRWLQVQENLATDCIVVLDDETFDLCPLANGPQRVLEYEFPSQFAETTFALSVGKRETEIGSKCPPGTWICMNTDRFNDPPIQVPITASFITGSQAPGGDLRRLPIYRSSAFDVIEAHVVFFCDVRAQGQSSPDLINEMNGVLLFAWPTSHACRQTTSSRRFTATEVDEAPEEGDQDDKPDDKQELIQRPISGSRLRSTASIILFTFAGLLILGYLIYSPPPVLRRYVSAFMRPLPFRVGEVRLVQWAQEDMGFLEDEVDVMVNGIMDEQIPLKPTPRFSRTFANYGSAE